MPEDEPLTEEKSEDFITGLARAGLILGAPSDALFRSMNRSLMPLESS